MLDEQRILRKKIKLKCQSQVQKLDVDPIAFGLDFKYQQDVSLFNNIWAWGEM